MDSFFGELKRRNVVRVAVAYVIVAWLIIQIAEALLPGFGAPDWIFKTLALLLALGFPVVLIFAWAFELTPDGLRKTRDVSDAVSVTASTGKKINFVIIGSLVLALGYFVWERQGLIDAANIEAEPIAAIETPAALGSAGTTPEKPASKRRSIAVLPFVNMSSDQEQEWFADGLTEEILNSLARTPDLLVAARTSSFKFKGSAEDIPTIALALGVEHVLEGSVRRAGERLRVTAQLIRAHDGFHLWSETFDRTVNDVIEIQEQVAIEIADALETAMDPEELARMVSTGTSSVAAYEAYLQGLSYLGAVLLDGDVYLRLDALAAFERAVESDPEFALGYWELASFWIGEGSGTLLGSGITNASKEEVAARFTTMIDNAIRFEKDPVRQMAYEAQKAREELRFLQALRLNTAFLKERPLDQDAQWLQLGLLRELGMYDEAADTVQRYWENDGYNSIVTNAALTTLLDVNRPEQLKSFSEAAIDRFPGDVNVLYQAHRALLWVGDIDGASRVVPAIQSSDMAPSARYLVNLRQACAEGKVATATRLYERALDEFADQPSIIWLSHTIMDRNDEAVSWLTPFDENGDFHLLADFLAYGRFDATAFPNFLAVLEMQGVEPHAPQAVPLRCSSPVAAR
jgi:TolB-like protein